MTPQEALTEALAAWTMHSDPGSTDEQYDARFLIDVLADYGFTVARTQDARDGEALRLLREACETATPHRAWFVAEWTYTRQYHYSPAEAVEVRVEKHVGDGRSRFRGPTIAEAADACREDEE